MRDAIALCLRKHGCYPAPRTFVSPTGSVIVRPLGADEREAAARAVESGRAATSEMVLVDAPSEPRERR